MCTRWTFCYYQFTAQWSILEYSFAQSSIRPLPQHSTCLSLALFTQTIKSWSEMPRFTEQVVHFIQGVLSGNCKEIPLVFHWRCMHNPAQDVYPPGLLKYGKKTVNSHTICIYIYYWKCLRKCFVSLPLDWYTFTLVSFTMNFFIYSVWNPRLLQGYRKRS